MLCAIKFLEDAPGPALPRSVHNPQETLVRSRVIRQIAAVAIAAMGGALAVYGSFDDSPGGTLLGILLVIGAAVCAGRAARRGC